MPEAAAPASLLARPASGTGVRTVGRVSWRATGPGGALCPQPGERAAAEETPVALTYNRSTHAVMLASPVDLGDFALGFSLSEGIITDPGQIEALEIVAHETGIELRMDLRDDRMVALARRQRRLAGPSGCGLCGMDSLAEAVRPVPRVPAGRMITAAQVLEAVATLSPAQALNQATRAMHAAAFWHPDRGLVALREDIGRHNALDKLAGALVRSGEDAAQGIVLLSSRVSIEMAQKAAILGAPLLVAVSAPTALAIRLADQAGMTLVGIARPDGFEVFSHPHRIHAAAGPHDA